MIKHNKTPTSDQTRRVFPNSNGSAFTHQPPQSEGNSNLRLSLGSKVKRVAMGIAAAVVIFAGAGFAMISNFETESPAAKRVLAVQTISVEPVNAHQIVRQFTGKIVARRTSQLGFELAGKLETLAVDEGDSVSVGSTLAKLDTEHLKTRRIQFAAKRTQAAAKLKEMITGPRSEDIDAARRRVESLQAEVALLSLQHQRRKKLIAKNVITRDEYEEYSYGLKSQEAKLAEAKHNLEKLQNGTRKEQRANTGCRHRFDVDESLAGT